MTFDFFVWPERMLPVVLAFVSYRLIMCWRLNSNSLHILEYPSIFHRQVIPAGGRGVVKTDLCIACPAGTYARIAPRSGLAVKKGIDVGAGVVDADYRGNVGVVLFNLGTDDFVVDVGDRIAQLILEKVNMAPVVEVEELTETERGAGGFGSTGVKESDSQTAKKQRTISPMPPAEGEATK